MGAAVGVVVAGFVLAVVLIPRGDEPELGSTVSVLVTTQTIGSAQGSEVPYDLADVRAAFKSGGVRLVTSRLDERGCPINPSIVFPGTTFQERDPITGQSHVSDARLCWRLDTRKQARHLPHVMVLTDSRAGRQFWTVWIYGNADDARGDQHGDWRSRTETSSVLPGHLFRLERAENVVVVYSDTTEADRIRDLLDRM